MFFIEPQSGLLSDFYSKSVLLPFGEYIPGAERFPFFKKILPVLSTYNSGTQSVSTYFFLGINWGPQICYEGLFPQKSYLSAKQGSQVLINLTSDRPFESKFEAEQHFRATAARSIEFRIPMIRVADSGYNGVIWADGTQKVDYLRTKPEAQSYTLAFKKKPYKTMYMILFNFWGFVYILNWPLIVLVKEILF